MNQDDRLGPYRLLRRLGEGGMGVVHLAVGPQGRQVAVKVLRAEVAGDDVARRRLSREVETMRRVRSDYIAEVIDADVTGHRPYIVTRYVPGRSLDDVVKEDGPLDLPGLLKVAHGVAAALAAVHSVGVIHRDLKPGNVLILDGDPVLIDFGIAQAVDATRLTQTGMFIGTPGYLAPEIIEGHEAGPEVDVHAWAGTLVYAATGQPPFGKGTLEMIFYNITAGKANVDGAPPELQPVLRAALARDPARRPPAAELAAMTARLLARTGERGRPRVPDEVTTVPHFDEPVPGGTGGHGSPAAPAGPGPATGSLLPPDPGEVPTPVASRPTGSAPAAPWPPAGRPGDYSSLLGEDRPDPWPTRRVTPEEMRQAAGPAPFPPSSPAAPPSPQASHELPTGALDPEDIPTGRVARDRTGQAGTGRPGTTGPQGAGTAGGPATAPIEDGDIPTQRVRPQDLPEYLRGSTPAQPHRPQAPQPHQRPSPQPFHRAGQQGAPSGRQDPHPYQRPQQQPYAPHASFEQAPASFETPHVRQPSAPYPYTPAPTLRQPPPGPSHPGPQAQEQAYTLQRSPAYGVASTLLLVVMAVCAVMLPVVTAIVVIPAVVMLRAADLAQPWLNARRPVREAAADVVRVLGQPGALAKSAGVTLALVPYGLILGLPVTLLLAVLVDGMPTANALSWGAAVALVTICAGPGVEGPGRQMRRTLASLLPSRNAAVATAAALGAVAALMVYLATGTVGDGARRAEWAPADVGTVMDELNGLRKRAAR
ncbi:protein kinase [Planomonospora corallina]|uniref:Protein kinase n=1 Tax=Planomonospora corallina TaxID=1806052 RepID=A0ABV8I976_9ACTN